MVLMAACASREDLFVLAGSLGKLWRRGRRTWPPELRRLYAEVLLFLRAELLPDGTLSACENIGESRHDIRGLADLFKNLATRKLQLNTQAKDATTTSVDVTPKVTIFYC